MERTINSEKAFIEHGKWTNGKWTNGKWTNGKWTNGKWTNANVVDVICSSKLLIMVFSHFDKHIHAFLLFFEGHFLY